MSTSVTRCRSAELLADGGEVAPLSEQPVAEDHPAAGVPQLGRVQRLAGHQHHRCTPVGARSRSRSTTASVGPFAAGLREVLWSVLDHEHLIAVVVDVASALVVLRALLGHGEVVADPGAVQTGEVLLAGRETVAVRLVDEQPGEPAACPFETSPPLRVNESRLSYSTAAYPWLAQPRTPPTLDPGERLRAWPAIRMSSRASPHAASTTTSPSASWSSSCRCRFQNFASSGWVWKPLT